jgi:iron complex transport system ATP-binding protein
MDASLNGEPVLSARQISVAVSTRELVNDLTIDFSRGELLVILGRNGSGKTLTLHTLAGLRQPQNGEMLLGGIPFPHHNRRNVARRLGILAQDVEEAFVTSAIESVLIGRHPHLALWQWETSEDERIALNALRAVDLADFAERRTDTLSGGELRRVAIAALLAQEPDIYLLDEPTNHLDPRHQLSVLGLFRELARSGRTVITTLHDPTLAARFADRVLLLFGDGCWKAGPAGDVLTADNLTALYASPMLELQKDGRRVFVNA